MIEGHDMLMCNRIEVHYDNISKNKKEVSEGVYLVDDATVEGNNLIFSWLVSGNATRLAGNMQFGINFRCIDADDEVTYSWTTDTFKSVRIIASNQNTDVVVAGFPDVLEQWKKEVINDLDVVVSDEQVSAAVFEYLDKNPVTGGVDFETDDTLKLENGILSVNTTNQMEQDNTRPITSAGVYATVGNIEALLKTI
jgi:hypothetical protein